MSYCSSICLKHCHNDREILERCNEFKVCLIAIGSWGSLIDQTLSSTALEKSHQHACCMCFGLAVRVDIV